MRLLWIGAFVVVIVSLASLISGGYSGALAQQSWLEVSSIIPEAKLNELQRATPVYTARIFASFPQPFRDKLGRSGWSAVELITFRALVLTHLAPAVLLPLLIGLLEGWWARANQKRLIKIHSPMRFNLALTGLGLIPLLALLWVTAPMAVPVIMLVCLIGVFAIFNTRNVIVHAPTQF
jgi:hypothetical protein